MEGVLDADMISILKLTPRIVQNKSGVVCQLVDPPDWVKLLIMHDPTTVVKAGQWIRVCNGSYKGDVGFVMEWKLGEFRFWSFLTSRDQQRHRQLPH